MRSLLYYSTIFKLNLSDVREILFYQKIYALCNDGSMYRYSSDKWEKAALSLNSIIGLKLAKNENNSKVKIILKISKKRKKEKKLFKSRKVKKRLTD